MPFIAPGFGQATIVFQIPGPSGPAMCTFGYDHVAPSTPDEDATAVRAAFVFTGSLLSRLSSQASLLEVRTLRRTGAGELQSGIDTTAAAGLASGDSSPPQVALLVQKLTGFSGKNRRGRFYLPKPPETQSDGSFSPAQHTANQAACDVFYTRFTTEFPSMRVLHTSEVDTPTTVTELEAVQLSATQRRRIR